MMPFVPLAALLITSMVIVNTADAATVRVTITPVSDARQIKMSAQLHDDTLVDPVVGATNDVPLPRPDTDTPDRRDIFVRWSDGSDSKFPVVLTNALGDRLFELHFMRPPAQLPTLPDVRRDCNISSPTSIEAAFRAYYICRAYVLALEESQEFHPIHRIALAGWFIANYSLYTRFPPISPYGFDRELAQRLQKVVALVRRDGYRADRLAPIRVADVERALAEVEAEAVRAAGLVPSLIHDGDIATADRVNRSAIEALNSAPASNMKSFGINNTVLIGNQALIDRLIDSGM